MKKLVLLISLFILLAPPITYAKKFEVVCSDFYEIVNGQEKWNTPFASDTYYVTIDLTRNRYYLRYLERDGNRINGYPDKYGQITTVKNGIIFVDGRLSGKHGGPFEIQLDIFNGKYNAKNFYPKTNKLQNEWGSKNCYDPDNFLTDYLKKDK